jgi:S-adenosylmethionine:tRNA-ribosyltransferase-isomerase (queuine synthetase)
MNDTRVIPARLFALRNTGGEIEFLFLRSIQAGSMVGACQTWATLRTGEVLRMSGRQLDFRQHTSSK